METEETSFIFGSDKRQDTTVKALPAARFTDTGGQSWGDKRRDTTAEGCWVYVCGLRAMIKDKMDTKEPLS